MADLKDLLTTVGALLGILAFLWKIWDSLLSYLNTALELHSDATHSPRLTTALATLENQGTMPKRVHYAGLLIGREWNSLESVARTLVSSALPDARKANSRNPLGDLLALTDDVAIFAKDGSAGWIPLPFFYRDQRQLGNEKVQFRCSVDTERLTAGANYSVFFVVFVRYPLGILRWRATSDLLTLA
jgi:hypothetical protein